METLDFLDSAYAFSEAPTGEVALPLETVALDGNIYAANLKGMQYSSQSTFRDSTVTGETASDSLFNMNGAWARYRTSWHHGGDQEIADLRDEVDLYRFNTSVGIDCWTENQLTLAHSCDLVHAGAGNCLLIEAHNIVVHTAGTQIYRSIDDGANWTAASGPGLTIYALATDGIDVYLATAGGIYKMAAGASPATLFGADTNPVHAVAFVAGRLLCSKANVLQEVSAAGARTTVKTHFQASFIWNVIFAIGSRIYVAGYAGAHSELYSLTTDSTGNLVQSNEAASFTHDEVLNGGFAYAGVVILLTSKGARMARVADDGSLVYGALIEDVGACQYAAADGRFVYVGHNAAGGTGLARLALDVTTNSLTPAWAMDLFTETTGVVTGVAVANGRVLLAATDIGVMWQGDGFATEGTITSGRLSFGTVEPKHLTELSVSFDPLGEAETVTAELLDETGDPIATATASVLGTSELVLDLDAVHVQHCEVRLTLAGTGGTPRVTQWRLLAYPVPPPVLQWVVPLRFSTVSTIGDNEGEALTIDVITELERIAAWYRSKDRITFQIADRAYGVRVDEFVFESTKWDDEQTFLEGVCTVRLVEA